MRLEKTAFLALFLCINTLGAGMLACVAPAFLLPKAKLQIAPASPVQTNYENLPLHK
jgi:hypothetical protein